MCVFGKEGKVKKGREKHTHLGTHATIQPGCRRIQKDRVVDVRRAESQRRQARIDIAEEVVVVSHFQEAGVLCSIAVGVADERALPVVFERVPGDGHVVCCVGYV